MNSKKPRRILSLLDERSLLLIAVGWLMVAAPLCAAQKIRGMSFAHSLHPEKGYGSAASLDSLRELRRIGVDSIAITPFGFQRLPTDTKIVWVGNRGSWIGESDDRLRAVTRQAHELGLTVMLKPHLWLRPPQWPGSIDHRTGREWKAWFA